MEIIFVRHGLSLHNEGLSNSWDSPLSAKGVRQAEETAKALLDVGIDRILCSPMRRALHTATIIGEALTLRPEVRLVLSEHGYGWEEPGMSNQEICKAYPNVDIPTPFCNDGWAADRTHETLPELQSRMQGLATTIRRMAVESSAKVCLLVGHGKSATELIKSLLHIPKAIPVYFHHHNCGITKLYMEKNGTVNVLSMNETAHLSGSLLSKERSKTAPDYR